jgi:hypothetical protein
MPLGKAAYDQLSAFRPLVLKASSRPNALYTAVHRHYVPVESLNSVRLILKQVRLS